MNRSSVRDYAILFVGRGGRAGAGGGATIGGGNAIVSTPVHRLDGAEHQAPDDTTRLDATMARHGLLPKLSGDPAQFLDGEGAWSAPDAGGFVPTYVVPAGSFVVPANRQALFALPIVLGAGAGISIGTNAALVEVD